MSYFVICNYPLLLLAEYSILSLVSGNYCLHAFLKIFLGNLVSSLTNGSKGCFIDDVCKLCSAGATCCPCNGVEINIVFSLYVLCMDFEDCDSSLKVWKVYRNSPVKAARTQKGRVKDFRPIGGC